ncbi:GntR family transcriptional regulator [Paracoccus methylarcula]|uniref:GntR family transcriptional regulator n=1 Tax=Paracoccus methylarcula TaxID=72022 RepID=UPI001FE815B0|nr:GntR family transcriptional regulator [Paracoccus methylarcula]
MKEISKESLGATIYDQLAQALVRGMLRPDQKVTIRGLAEMLGTSSTPVRDAIQRMLQDQVLEQRSPRDVRVPVLEVAQYLEISRIRIELEGMAAEQAARQAKAGDISRLKRIVAQTGEAMAGNRWIRAVEHNQRFHFALASMADMPVLLSILHRLWLRMGPLIAGYYESAREDLVGHHRKMIAACETHDGAAARAAMRADIEEPRKGIIAYINSFETGQPGKLPGKG